MTLAGRTDTIHQMMVESKGVELLDAEGLSRKIEDLARGLARFVDDPARAYIVGIRRRGAILAQRVQRILESERGWKIPLGALDITLYRDDLSQMADYPLIASTDLELDIDGRTILLIDDVIYTGRTVRSAIDELVDFGRPRCVRLGVLVDRGHREYPLQPDFAAMIIETTDEQVVKVMVAEYDERECVILTERNVG